MRTWLVSPIRNQIGISAANGQVMSIWHCGISVSRILIQDDLRWYESKKSGESPWSPGRCSDSLSSPPWSGHSRPKLHLRGWTPVAFAHVESWISEVHSGIEYRKISFNVSASNGPTSKKICFGSDYWTHDDHLLWLKHCHRLTRHELYTRTLWFKCRHCSHLSVPISSDCTNMSEISHLSTSIYAGKQALAFLAIIQGSCGSTSQCEDHLLLPSM